MATTAQDKIPETQPTSPAELSGEGLSGNVEGSKFAGGPCDDTVNASLKGPANRKRPVDSPRTQLRCAVALGPWVPRRMVAKDGER